MTGREYFKDNIYTTEYFKLIEFAKSRLSIDGYFENHHIIPKSLGGSDDVSNIVSLTAQEHFLAHKLLVDMTEGNDKVKMSYAFWQMANVKNDHQSERYTLTSEEFQEAKQIRSTLETSQETRDKIGKSRKNKTAMYHSILDKVIYVDYSEVEDYKNQGYEHRGRPKSESCKESISRTNKEKGILPPIGWNKGLTKETDARLEKSGWSKGLTKDTDERIARMAEHAIGRIPHNKGKTLEEIHGEEKAKDIRNCMSASRGNPIIVDGISYPSIAAACKALGIVDYRTLKRRLTKGKQ